MIPQTKNNGKKKHPELIQDVPYTPHPNSVTSAERSRAWKIGAGVFAADQVTGGHLTKFTGSAIRTTGGLAYQGLKLGVVRPVTQLGAGLTYDLTGGKINLGGLGKPSMNILNKAIGIGSPSFTPKNVDFGKGFGQATRGADWSKTRDPVTGKLRNQNYQHSRAYKPVGPIKPGTYGTGATKSINLKYYNDAGKVTRTVHIPNPSQAQRSIHYKQNAPGFDPRHRDLRTGKPGISNPLVVKKAMLSEPILQKGASLAADLEKELKNPRGNTPPKLHKQLVGKKLANVRATTSRALTKVAQTTRLFSPALMIPTWSTPTTGKGIIADEAAGYTRDGKPTTKDWNVMGVKVRTTKSPKIMKNTVSWKFKKGII